MAAANTRSGHWLWLALAITLGLVVWVHQAEVALEADDGVSHPPSRAMAAPQVLDANARQHPSIAPLEHPATQTVTMGELPRTPRENQSAHNRDADTSPTVAMQQAYTQDAQLGDALQRQANNHLAITAPVRNSPMPWQRSPIRMTTTTLFAPQQWLPPPVKPAPPPPPSAPPPPFQYIGTFDDVPEGKTILLMQQNKMLMIKVGARVNAQWQLLGESAQQVFFTYLPLQAKVTLSKAAKPAAQRARVTADQEDAFAVDDAPPENQ